MSTEKDAATMDAEGKCIICRTKKEPRRRGLCEMHHARWWKLRSQIPVEKQPEFDADLIADGKLLPNKQGQKLRPEDNEFLPYARKYLVDKEPVVIGVDEALQNLVAVELRDSLGREPTISEVSKRVSERIKQYPAAPTEIADEARADAKAAQGDVHKESAGKPAKKRDRAKKA